MGTNLGKPIPTLVITGPLGVGKTTVITHLLAHKPVAENWVVLLNEFSDAGIDALTVAAAARGAYDVRMVPGGCLCCAGEDDFRRNLRDLIDHVHPDRIIVEPSGIGHPTGIVDELLGYVAQGALVLERVIGLIDPQRLLAFEADREEPARAAIEISDVLVMTKSDSATVAERADFERHAAALFPSKIWVGAINQGKLPESAWHTTPSTAARISTHIHAHSHNDLLPSDAITTAKKTPAVVVGLGERLEFAHLGRHGARWCFPRSIAFSESRVLALLSAEPATERIKAVLRIDEDEWVLVQRAAGRIEMQSTAWRRDNRIEVLGMVGVAWDAEYWDNLWLRCMSG